MFAGGTSAFVVCAAALLASAAAQQAGVVTLVNPSKVGVNGAVRINITGNGFAADLFNFGDGNQNLGNLVWLTSVTQSFVCDVFKEGCNPQLIQCYTRPMPEGTYTVSVAVDGQTFDSSQMCPGSASSCQLTVSLDVTPTITVVTPTTGPPGGLVDFYGKIKTDCYGNNVAASSNGVQQHLLRVFFSGLGCDVMQNAGTATATTYRLQLDSNTSDTGHITCKRQGNYIGVVNGSFIIEPPYGRSLPDLKVLRPWANGIIGMFQVYTGVSGVTPMQGSLAGGTQLTITGNDFDSTTFPLQVQVAGVPCNVTSFNDTEIICTVGPQPGNASSLYGGGRGLLHEIWYNTSVGSTLAQIANLSTNSKNYESMWIDQASFSYKETVFATKTSGFFKPVNDGSHLITISCPGGKASVYFSPVTGNFEDKIIAVSCNGGSASSARWALRQDKLYFVQILHQANSATNLVQMGFTSFNTTLTASMTGSARNEQQRIVTSTVASPEVQNVSFINWSSVYSSTPVNEVQIITLQGAGPDSTFRLNLEGSRTGWMAADITPDVVAAALNSLPTVLPDSVSVTKTGNAYTQANFTVTFLSRRGVWQLLVVELTNSGASSVTRSVVGIPAADSATLEMDGIKTKPFDPCGPSSAVKSAVEDLFSVRCPLVLTNPAAAKTAYFNDFENLPSGAAYTEEGFYYGVALADHEPFCGRMSMQNPSYLFRVKTSISMKIYPKLCFAYLGNVQNWIGVNYSYIDSGIQKQAVEWYQFQGLVPSGGWNYQCVDLLAAVQGRHSKGIYFQITWAQIYSGGVGGIYIDNVYVGKEDAVANYQASVESRLLPPRSYLATDVKVESPQPCTYTIYIYPVNCSSDFSLFVVPGALYQNQSSNTTVALSIVNISRFIAASKPVGGFFDITILNRVVPGIPSNATAAGLAAALQLAGVGTVNVNSWGSCNGYSYNVEFVMAGGDLPTMAANGTNLSGTGVQVVVYPIVDGSVSFLPAMGDMLSVPEKNPQVTVQVNGVPSVCLGNCTYIWSADNTPILQSLTPTAGPGSVQITIKGSGFGNNVAAITVALGNQSCAVRSVSDTQIVCAASLQSRGKYPVMVSVFNNGVAAGSLTYEHISACSGISPASGSTTGGTQVTMYGIGFEATMSINLGGSACIMTNFVNETLVNCITQPAVDGAGIVNVSITFLDGAVASLSGGFTYTQIAGIATVASINTSVASVDGTTEMSIVGTGFGQSSISASAVLLVPSLTPVKILRWSDQLIMVLLPAQAPGSYQLRVLTSAGYADLKTHNITDVLYQLEWQNYLPKQMSAMGGTVVTVFGAGFSSNMSLDKVSFGDVSCNIQSATPTELTCVTASSSARFTVNNSGTAPKLGTGYGWLPSSLTIQVGDTVQWTWQAPVPNIAYSIQQVTAPGSSTPVVGGFNNTAPATAQGSFQYRFTEAGTYNYWSKPISLSNPSFALWGSVQVVAKPDNNASIGVTVNGYPAVQTQAAAADRRRREITKRQANCVPEDPAAVCPNSPASMTASCTPIVTRLQPTRGTKYDSLQLTGSLFSTQDCNNIVTVGGQPCTVSGSNGTFISCTVDPAGVLEAGVPYDVSLVVNNLGNAIVKVGIFTLIPWIDSISPSQGSTEGGQLVTITGGGFLGSAQVSLGLAKCTVPANSPQNYSRIVCMTSAAPVVKAAVVVYIVSNAMKDFPVPVQAVSHCPNGCTYTYNDSFTPKVASVLPEKIAGLSTQVQITGFILDDPDALIYIGGQQCKVDGDSVSASTINCTVGCVPVGPAAVRVTTKDGSAVCTTTLTSQAMLTGITPASGSTNGGTRVTITGNGFVDGATTVTVGGVICTIISPVQCNQIICTTSAHAAASGLAVQVTANGISYPALVNAYSFSAASTSTITSASPSSGLSGTIITLTGTYISANAVVLIGQVPCNRTDDKASTNQVTCQAGAAPSGLYQYRVLDPSIGLASIAVGLSFTYTMTANNVSPNEGSYSGGQTITIAGSGFASSTTKVTICGTQCSEIVNAVPPSTSTEYRCKTPANSGTAASTVCPVNVTSNGLTVQVPVQYTYLSSKTAQVTAVSPKRGGTAGGTLLTITGSGFQPSPTSTVVVTIDGVHCNITSTPPSDTIIYCQTGAHRGTAQVQVEVNVDGNGIATQVNAGFWYVDRWSSIYTWGGSSLPVDGDFVVIPPGQTILLDINTSVLSMLLIQGELIFDEADVELKAHNILITDGGTLQVGTEDEPFRHKAIITLYGQLLSLELPIYGAKNLGVRNGTLDLHGQPRITWTVLERTALNGSNTLQLRQAVNWEVGDRIVIATTGDEVSQFQNEEHVIASVSPDGKTIKLVDSLAYVHLGETLSLCNGETLEMRAEVGLLTRNVVVRGSVNAGWNNAIPPCPLGFDPGEFAVQTCFQGRFGQEIGSDGFGATIMMSAPEMDTHLVTHRISYVEVTNAGQQFRIGRYPIHLHMNGDMSNSYVRGCSIHHTFNRAMNIHNTHNTLFEYNVVYHVEGGAVFLEDSIEHGNTLQYNLAVHVIPSSSLLNDDVTPAAFWVTFPNNTIQHNHAAGGSHFGFWYRMLDHPNGPSFDATICPKRVPLGVFYNNSAHSFGWFGLWTFDEYYPSGTGKCSDTVPTPAVFEKLTAWHCTKGAEFVYAGSLQFRSFLLVNNQHAGIEGKRNFVPVAYQYTDQGPLVVNSTVVGCDPYLDRCSKFGLLLPYSNGLNVRNVTFVNFSTPGSSALGMTTIDGVCLQFCGGYTYKFSGIRWCNCQRKAYFRWEHEASFEDLDGSLSGTPGSKIVPYNPTLNTGLCSNAADFSCGDVRGVTCTMCGSFHRMAFNNIHPLSLFGNNALLINDCGVSVLPFRPKDITHKKGWFLMLPGGNCGQCGDSCIAFEDMEFITNVTYTSQLFYIGGRNDYIVLCHKLMQRIDRVAISPSGQFTDASACPLTYDNNYNYDYCISENSTVYYMASDRNGPVKRAATPTSVRDGGYNPQFLQCAYPNCLPPADAPPTPVTCTRPISAKFWSDNNTWKNGLPVAGANLTIASGDWVVLNIANPPPLGQLFIYGTLELEYKLVNGSYLNINLSATHIVIQGGHLIAGCEGNPIKGQVTITLIGDHTTPELVASGGYPVIGAKVIGVFGGLDLHGVSRTRVWTKLSQTAEAGTTILVVEDPVTDWVAGDEIAIATSVFSRVQNEKAVVSSISTDGKTITLQNPLQYKHIGAVRTAGDYKYSLSAEVGLLTRNLRVVGNSYPNLQKDAFGSRILVGQFFDGQRLQTGYARVEFVEFINSGQFGFVDDYDPRYSLTWLDAGPVSDAQPSYCLYNSFHDGFNTAIGVHGVTSGLRVEENVIFGTVGGGIIVSGTNITLRRNLVMSSWFLGSYNGRFQKGNTLLMGSIEVYKGTDVILTDNAVAGSERSGYRIKGIPCDGKITWSGNVAHGVLLGVDIMPESIGTDPCTWITGFTIYKAAYFGIYSQCPFNTKVSNVTLVNNGLSLMTYVIFPSIVLHEMVSREIWYEDSLLVGRDTIFGCDDVLDDTLPYVMLSIPNMLSWTSSSGGYVGMSFGSFMSGPNQAPGKPYRRIMTFNGLYGLTRVNRVTFANFGLYCKDSIRDVVISTAIANDDGQHPVQLSGLKMINVDKESLVNYFRPDINLINSADCVDMDCDGKKKNLIKDLDGSFLGKVGFVIPQSQYEWNGDSRRGLGDYRIPKALLADLNGEAIPVETVAPYKGIVGNDNCSWVDEWLAYECFDVYNYEMLMIESMDPDTETRRLSPVAILVNDYIDLINGPQDHGWCDGYTCRMRVSTFMALVALAQYHELYFTSTSPQHLRLHLINTNDTQQITMGIYYTMSNRIDIYVNGVYIPPLNSYMKGNTMQYHIPQYAGQYWPNSSSPNGANFQDKWTQLVYVAIRGPAPVDIIVSDLILVSFEVPAMTVAQFFGPEIVNNIANFLGLQPSQIRVVNVVSESSGSSGRRKRGITAASAVVQLEIGNAAPVVSLSTNATTSMNYSQLTAAYLQLTDAIQTGVLSSVMNVTFTKVYIAAPVPSSSSSDWTNFATQLNDTTSPGAAASAVVIPAQLYLASPKPSGAVAGRLLPDQLELQLLSADSVLVTKFGSIVWAVTASLTCSLGSNASLSGTTIVNITAGWANYTDLSITSPDQNCVLSFCVSNPSSVCTTMKATTGSFSVAAPTSATSAASPSGPTTSGAPVATSSSALPTWAVAVIVVGAVAGAAIVVSVALVLAKKAAMAQKINPHEHFSPDLATEQAAVVDSPPAATTMPSVAQ